jgi:hypothetical protein
MVMSDKLSSDELEGLRVSEAIRQGVLIERAELRAENERLREWAKAEQQARYKAEDQRTDDRSKLAYAEVEAERLRAALAEMLQSFTEPEDDNDILRRARAALGQS